MTSPASAPASKAHYAYVTRRVIDLFEHGRLPAVSSIDVEPAYGYVTRLTYHDGHRRITYGNDLGVDAAASVELARDKGHAKFVLSEMGVRCPRGREFLLPSWTEQIRAANEQAGNTELITSDQAAVYVDAALGYPVYVKPVAGTKGEGVRRVTTPTELGEALGHLDRERARVAVVEEAVDLPDHRIVTFDGELVCAYRRIPPAGSAISNLSAGGTADDVTATIHPRWIALAADIARAFGLRVCGTDLACADITDASADHCVFEVNATPGLEHFAASGPSQHRVVDDFYERVINDQR